MTAIGFACGGGHESLDKTLNDRLRLLGLRIAARNLRTWFNMLVSLGTEFAIQEDGFQLHSSCDFGEKNQTYVAVNILKT